MKESMWGYILILLGIGISTIMIMISNMTTTNQQDYYLLKEVTNASVIDSIDFDYYREYGEIKINTQKFLEVFLRRFSESISKSNTYKLDFYSIYENPPSVNIRVTSKSGEFEIFGDRSEFDVINSYDAILEFNNKIIFDRDFYSVPYASCTKDSDRRDSDGYCKIQNFISFTDLSTYITQDLEKLVKDAGYNFDKNKIKVVDAKYLKPINSDSELVLFQNQYVGDSGNSDSDGVDLYNRDRNTNDIPWGNRNNKDEIASDSLLNNTYLANDIKNVVFTVQNDDEDGNYVMAWGGKFNCDKTYGDEGIVKQFRKVPNTKNNLIKEYNKNSNYDVDYAKANVYQDVCEDESCEYTPYYNACLVGIKYKITFEYDPNA